MEDDKPVDNRTFKKIFQTDPLKKAKMLEMLRNKISPSAIAKHFGADHSTILYHKRRQGIETSTRVGRPLKPKPTIEPKKPKKVITYQRDLKDTPLDHYFVNGERHSTGKNYADYVREEAERKERLSPLKRFGG